MNLSNRQTEYGKKTSFVLGFIRTKIYVPTGLGVNETEYVIAHERTHIRRLDYLIKPLAFLITSVHCPYFFA